MQEELKKLVLKYADGHKDIDYDFICKTIMIAGDYYSLDEYIKKIYLFKNRNGFNAAYFWGTQTIYFNQYLVLKSIEEIEKIFSCLEKSYFFKYLYAVQTLLHEIEHVKQCNVILKGNDLESEILRAEFEPFLKASEKMIIKKILEYRTLNKRRKEVYLFSPAERLAQINSYKTLVEISEILNDRMCYEIAQYYKYDSMRRGYNCGLKMDLSDAPTEFFLKQFNPGYDFEKILKMSIQLDAVDLIKFGLQSSPEELNRNSEYCMKYCLELSRRMIK